MDTKNYIVKKESTVPAEDYNFLRSKGLKHIEKLSGKIWTDFNVHDPGITMMEVLCYAITDVAYRTSFDMKDLLTARKDQGGIKELYTARKILSCNPVTINDFRKVLIDVEGIKNAWLRLAGKQEQTIYMDCTKSRLISLIKPKDIIKYKDNELVLDGLYDVVLELEDDIVLGDLNDYSFDEEYQDIHFTFSFPTWDFLYKQKTDPENWKFTTFECEPLVRGTKIHKAAITVNSSACELIIPVTFILEGKRNLDNENTVISYLIGSQAKILFEKYLKKISKALKIVSDVRDSLSGYRNLCEDFKSFQPIDVEEIALCADILVNPGAELEKIYARILFEVGRFLAPDVQFYSLEDLLNEKTPVEDIFEGPALSHGFIKDADLKRSELPKEIHVSDIINIIMDIEGVLAVKKIQLGSYHNGIPNYVGEDWNLPVNGGRAPRLRSNLADLTFYKDLIPYNVFDEEKISLYYEEFLQSIRNSKLKEGEYDLEVPKGNYLDVADYISVQEDFPLVYGIGKKGIPGIIDDERRARAKQLKAFLTLYDQLLANYLSQLSHLKDILSFRDDIGRTYFSQLPYKIPDAGENSIQHMKDGTPEVYRLIKAFTDTLSSSYDMDKYRTYASLWETFAKNEDNEFVRALHRYSESPETFTDRRNRFLDHLMARFAEQFTDYVLLMYKINKSEDDDGLQENKLKSATELMEDKAAFLRDYPEISAPRGKGFNYRECENLWSVGQEEGSNVSGYKKRLTRLTGIDSFDRKILSCNGINSHYEIFKGVDDQWYFHFGVPGDVLLRSEGYTQKHNCVNGINSVVRNGTDTANYESHTAQDGTFYYNLVAQNNEIVGTSPMFLTEKERNEKRNELVSILESDCNTEGFHLLEHILLRPRNENDDLLPVCLEPGCNNCIGLKDPYSFRMTLVLPAWVKRFTDMDFRRYFQKTARMEAPAHIHVKICWVELSDMENFEKAYKTWLQKLCRDDMDKETHDNMIKILTQLKSIYPEGTLHDCAEDENENPIILGHTNIGSAKSE